MGTVEYEMEKWQSFYPDFRPVWENYHCPETWGDRDGKQLNHFAYAQFEMNGQLAIFTARDCGWLVGYIVVTKIRDVSFLDTLSVFTNLYYVLPTYRSKGVFNKLFSLYEEWLQTLPRPFIAYVDTKIGLDHSERFERKGYEKFEIMMRKDYI